MVGISAAITDNDSVITSYRDHCTHLAKGGTMLEVMAELMGRVDGASKGKGGSMHMYRKVGRFTSLFPLCAAACITALPLLPFIRVPEQRLSPAFRVS